MEVTVNGRNTTVSEPLRQITVEKIGRLDRFLKDMDRADVLFWEEKNPRIGDKEYCEVTMEGHGHHVRCKVSAPDSFTAVDIAVDKLERQLRKLKTRVKNRQQGHRKIEVPEDLVPDTLVHDESVDHPELVYKIVKSKTFVLSTMSTQEAALQMDLLNHDFYLFTNAETEQSAVVYRRDDGDIGLIEAG